MGISETIKIAVADPSIIIRSGVSVILKKIRDFKIMPIEISSYDNLYDCLKLNQPDILIINPNMLGYSDLRKLKEETLLPNLICIALITCLHDNVMLKYYEGTLSLNDDLEKVESLLTQLADRPFPEENVSGKDILSSREKEIITCVVKGMTNKEIADHLFLSTHTVITHRRNISRKLQIHSPAGLTIYAIINKLVELQDIKDNIS